MKWTDEKETNTSSLVPTVKCESNIILVSLNKCFLEALGFDSSTFQLNNNSDSCTNSYTETVNSTTMQIIQALPQTGWCGNEVITDSLKVYYSNALHIGIQNRSIITVNPLNINFSCSYNLTMQTSLVGAFKPVVNSVNLTINGEGSALTTMSAYWDQAYTKQIQENEDVPIGSNVYLDIVSDAGDVDSFVLRVDSCYATPDNNVNNVNKVAIVSSGCPANQGVTAEVQENGVSLESRIKFNSFAFQGQPLVYITCIVRLCGKNTTCTGCNAARSTDGQAQLQIPINFIDDYSSSASNTAVSWVAMTSSLLVFLTVKLF
ncbi:pancreatic secretory granule membrane major glycoprotein GP2-like [Mixophyes fleayi]|uniref:pancreatic secretory granule membrane major glycoprotein GP2-like n=1 Tax=Mixophyes fleayi TaxID=3061075 RepID=UPI003F4D956B